MTTAIANASQDEEEVQISVTGIPKSLLKRIAALAKSERRSRASYIVSRLERAVDRDENSRQAA